VSNRVSTIRVSGWIKHAGCTQGRFIPPAYAGGTDT